MTAKLEGKAALVTGGGRGIGQAIAQQFAGEGARVAVADVDPETARRTAADLPTEGFAVEMDVSCKSAVESGVADAVKRFGQLDILVNNAGILTYTTFEDCTEQVWDRMIDVNLKGTFLCTQAVLPHMKDRRQGVILNMTSVAAKTGGLAAGPPYAAAKAGIYTLTIGYARALAPHRVRVNGIAPGVIDTAMTQSAAHADLMKLIPLGEKGQPEDVARCALFLASDDGRHITGEIIDVNGGLFMD